MARHTARLDVANINAGAQLHPFRCVCCGEHSLSWEGCCDELERLYHQPDAGDDNGLCDGCWVRLDVAAKAATTALVDARKGGR